MPDEEGQGRGRGRRGGRARDVAGTGRARGAAPGKAVSPQRAVADALAELLEQCGEALGFDVGRNWPTDLGAVDLVWFHDLDILVPEVGLVPGLERRLPVVGFEIEGGGLSPKHVNAAALRLAGLAPALGVVVLGPDSGDEKAAGALQEAARGWLSRLGAHSLAVWTYEDVRSFAALVVEKLHAERQRAAGRRAAGKAGRADRLVTLVAGARPRGRRGRRVAAAGKAASAPVPDAAALEAIVSRGDINKSEKIRRLLDLGVPRARVAELLGIKYQFVYNVEKRYVERGPVDRRRRRARADAGPSTAGVTRRRRARRPAAAAAGAAGETGKRRRGRPAKRRRPRIKPGAGATAPAGGGGTEASTVAEAPGAGEGAAR